MRQDYKILLKKLIIPISILAILWGIEILEYLTEDRYTRFAIFPRDANSILGIISAHFIHSDWGHLISNSFPMFGLVLIMMFFYERLLYPVLIGIMMLTGTSVWLFARESYHLGSSGVVYGLIGFIFWSGIFRGNLRSTVLSLVILIGYSSYFQGLTPEEGVSWESHLFGGISGAFLGLVFKNVAVDGEKDFIDDPVEKSPEIKKRFFHPDIFLKTKYQRYLDSLTVDEGE